MDCGPSCLRMIAKYYGHSFSLQSLREKSFLTHQGVSMLGISEAAESIGFRTQGVRISFEQLVYDVPHPCILHWNQNHFVVCYNIRKRRKLFSGENNVEEYRIYISDPANGLLTYTKEEFLRCWISTKSQNQDKGIALVLYTTPAFYDQEDEKMQSKANLRYFFKYLRPHRSQLLQLAAGMMLSSVLSLIFPFLSQTMVDVGIGNNNLSLITLILIAQLVLFITQLGMDYIRSWIVLHMTNRLSISLISDFLIKLMKLLLGFFDIKMVGDIMQRIGDHGRIQSFLTGTSLSVVFSFTNFIVFSFVLVYFNPLIFTIFLVGNTCYVLWILAFMRYRRELDYKRFTPFADQSNMVELS